MTEMFFDYGDVRIAVPKKYLPEILSLGWLWGNTELVEKIETTGSNIIDIDREEFIQLTELLYAIIR